ncbi:peptidoglycan synthetase [Vicingus serpentipes]|uniref:Peptidoglycan synthetase n=1 Tax=Vicingus serpentipes TaxID=1926625 RepID=A0A5C6RXN3_9FLAO|nr:Mur ligase family protein [Vicingus serpentipes]TXB66804.1 peptidoglycan synthetase [Vicingus serpentipes]
MRVHFIAIGGSAMHNLAIALHKKGFNVTGSDDEIFEPSKGRIAKYGLLPEEFGWFPEKITTDLDAIILGMHARIDNPELLKAQELGVKVYSYPEYIYEQSKNKIRVVIGGSHGKTSITSMILHVLGKLNIDFDYMVGAQLKGFDTMVKITDSKLIILEGDEYLSSPIDRRPKFHLYHPNIALISGIAWDHINVFPTFENYVEQFSTFVSLIEKKGALIYCKADAEVNKVALMTPNPDIDRIGYQTPENVIENGVTSVLVHGNKIPLEIFGDHNLQNLEGARLVCNQLKIDDEQFYEAIQDFKGASKRLELIAKNEITAVYKDFAHSPSKLKATTQAVKQQYAERKVIACMELHTFSSLNATFLKEYKDSMASADEAYVYYSNHTIAHKKLAAITPEKVKAAFGSDNVTIYNNSDELFEMLSTKDWNNKVLLLMSSGNFDGKNLDQFGRGLVK